MMMFKLKSIAKYENPLRFSVPCPVKVARQHEALSALFGPDVQIDGKKYEIAGFNVHQSAGPVRPGETIGICVKPLL